MQFWTANKIAGEFNWPVDAVADAFCAAVTPRELAAEAGELAA